MTLVPRPTRTVVRLAATCLVLEAFLVLFAVLAAVGLTDVPDATLWSRGGALAVLCLLLAGRVRRRYGLVLGTLLQVVLVATGFVLTPMFFLGAVFAGLWFWFLYLGARIDATQTGHSPEPARGGQ